MGHPKLNTILAGSLLLLAFHHCYAEVCELESGSIIPLYIYPKTGSGENAWQRLYEAYNAHPINLWAIVNVNTGPGGSPDSNYETAIRELHSAGIKTLGYVNTDYGSRDQSVVKSEVDSWKQWYSTDGIFFDGMANENDNQKVQYYRELGSYAKAQGFTFTVGNPGTRTHPKYFDTMDNIVIFHTGTGIPCSDLICSQDTNGKGRGSVSVMSYNVRTLDTTSLPRLKSCAEYIFITDDSGSNPWDTLPHYLPQLFQALRV